MATELIEILDSNGKSTRIRKSKEEAHKDGSWHKSAHIWIFNSKGELLLQRRSLKIDSFPGLWDISVAGHISARETPEDAAVRELYEELGIKIKNTDLKKVEVRKISQIIPELNWYNNEFDYVYLLKFEGDISQLRLQEDEVECIKFIPLDELELDIKDPELNKKYVPHGQYYLDIIKAIRRELK